MTDAERAKKQLRANRQKTGTYIYDSDFDGFHQMNDPSRVEMIWSIIIILSVLILLVFILI